MFRLPSPVHPSRTRTYAFETPIADPALLAGKTGLEVLKQIAAGTLPRPPMAWTLEMMLTEVEPGFALFESQPGEFVYNPLGTVHGGYAATLLDSAMGCAVHSLLEAGQGYTTLEIKVNLVRPILARSGVLRTEGRIVHFGARTATAEGRIIGRDDGKLYAHGTATCIIVPMADRIAGNKEKNG